MVWTCEDEARRIVAGDGYFDQNITETLKGLLSEIDNMKIQIFREYFNNLLTKREQRRFLIDVLNLRLSDRTLHVVTGELSGPISPTYREED